MKTPTFGGLGMGQEEEGDLGGYAGWRQRCIRSNYCFHHCSILPASTNATELNNHTSPAPFTF